MSVIGEAPSLYLSPRGGERVALFPEAGTKGLN